MIRPPALAIVAILTLAAAQPRPFQVPAYPSAGVAMSDSAVRAAIAMGMSEKMGGFVPLIPLGDGRSISGWATGPMGRIVSSAAMAKSRKHPFTLDSVTPGMRAPVIVVFVRDTTPRSWG